eukprot:s1988_g12.t1
MGVCCSQSTPRDTASIFQQYDANGNGQLETAELAAFLRDAFPGKDLSNKQVDDFMKEFDADKSGTIGLNELHAFLRFYDSSSKTIRRKTALLVIDVQNDFISGTLAVQKSEGIVPTINQMRDQFDCVVISYDWHPHEHCSFVESANAGKVPLKETQSVGKLKAFSQVTLLGDADRAEHPQMLYPRHAVQNTWGSECHKDLVVKPEDMSVYKGKKANIDSYSAFFDNCKANDTGLTKQLEDAGVTDVYCCGLVFDICVIEDACKPLSESEVLPTKKVLNEAGVRVLTSAQAVAEVKQIKAAGSMALGDFIQQVAQHKNAAMLHKAGASLPIHRTQQLRPGLQVQIGDASRDWIAPIGEHHRANRQCARSSQEFEVMSG